MTTKLFEVRDRGTMIPVMAVQLDSDTKAELFLLAHSGFGRTAEKQSSYVVVLQLGEGCRGLWTCDPHDWPGTTGRTMSTAVPHIIEHFVDLLSGEVVDVEFLLGEVAVPKGPSRLRLPPWQIPA